MASLPPLIIETGDPMVEDELAPFTEIPGEEEIENQIATTVDETVNSREAGAAIAHIHGLTTKEVGGNYPTPVVDPTAEMFRRMAQKTDIIRVYARTKINLDVRREIAKKAGSGKFEMGSMAMNHLDFFDMDRQLTWDRPSIRETLEWDLEMGVMPEIEVFQVGATWNMRWSVEQGLLEAPYWVNVLSEVPGSAWSPATADSLSQRVMYLPENTLWHSTVHCEPRTKFPLHDTNMFYLQVIMKGGHIRIGKEDRLWIRPNEPAKTNAELVELVVWLAKKVGREIATPDQARKMLGLPRRNF